jgi:hypothetical protein
MFHGNWILRKLVQLIIQKKTYFYLVCRKRQSLLSVMINKTLRHTPKTKQRSKNFVANFLSGLSMYQAQKPELDDTSGVATSTTLNAALLSTVFEKPRRSIHCYDPTMATSLLVYTYVYNCALE